MGDRDIAPIVENQMEKNMEHEMEEDEEPGRPKGNRCPLYPALARLRPPRLKQLWVGKYGDPQDAELWDWYTVKGHREVHERAPSFSTAPLREQKTSSNPERWRHSSVPFASQPSRIRDARERGDRIATVLLAEGVSCRLFIPSALQHLFGEDQRGLFTRSPTNGEAAFPVLTPSSGRSALDEEVGLLDISPGMVDESGNALKFLQIVAVKPSEVEKYRMSAPFFVVMELPTVVTVTHPCYGKQRPEDLGVGCARHWLVRLASSLRMTYAFFLDDSVRSWRGVTLAEDQHNLFGVSSSSRAKFTPVPLAKVMSYLTAPEFEEISAFTAFGFARMAPELIYCSKAFRRAQVYSGFLLNVKKVEEEGLNYRQEVFVWEERSNVAPLGSRFANRSAINFTNQHLVANTTQYVDYAMLSGCRFQSFAFDGSDLTGRVADSKLEDWKAAVQRGSVKVKEFTKRLQAQEESLLQCVDVAYRLVLAEGVRSGIIATCRELSLWPPIPSPAVEADDCCFQDTSAPLPVIAQRAFNDEQRRVSHESFRQLYKKATTASFLVDFAAEAGLTLPDLQNSRTMLEEFMQRVEEWTERGSRFHLCPLAKARNALVTGLGQGGMAAETARELVAQRWSKNWETRAGTAVNVATAALAIGASVAALRRVSRPR
ncbi:unnamed protein product [Symbiodinium pilosum]|uniref:TET-Associated Glycosyltransferase domain-containing protein n=1 Tax=Symbiodinium pilosum TaxID=2952 RepID=A0A812UAF8_SYMPI|nr:unnamed protein product [Symbiodinium pilosum]